MQVDIQHTACVSSLLLQRHNCYNGIYIGVIVVAAIMMSWLQT
jgi:hypothetical protein